METNNTNAVRNVAFAAGIREITSRAADLSDSEIATAVVELSATVGDPMTPAECADLKYVRDIRNCAKGSK
jgi:hypothetical protein